MTQMLFDSVKIGDGARRTKDGYLAAYANVARTGIQLYKGSELGRPDLDVVRVYRPPEEVFHKDALKSMAHRPVTMNHPSEVVDAANWKKYAKGHTGDEIIRDGDHVRVPMVLMDAETIKAVESGTRELSMGYSTELKWDKGLTTDGEPYDAVQTEIRANHLAIVPVARGGSRLRFGDAFNPDQPRDKDGRWAAVAESMGFQHKPGGGHRPDLDPYQSYVHKGKPNDEVDKHLTAAGFTKTMKERPDSFGNDTVVASYHRTPAPYHDERADVYSTPGKGVRRIVHSIFKTNDSATVFEYTGNLGKHGISVGTTSTTNDADGVSTKGLKTMKTILIDGAPIEFADPLAASIVEKKLKSLADAWEDMKKKADEEEENGKKAKAACDAAMGENAILKKQVADSAITPEKLDALVEERKSVVDAASSFLPKDFSVTGKTLPEIRRAAVGVHLGDAAKDMSDDAVAGAFRMMTADGTKKKGGVSDLASAFGNRHVVGDSSVQDKAYDEYKSNLSNAWKGKATA